MCRCRGQEHQGSSVCGCGDAGCGGCFRVTAGASGCQKGSPQGPCLHTPPLISVHASCWYHPSRSSTGFKNTPFIWRDRKSNSNLVTSCCVPLHRDTPDRASRNPAFLWGPAGLTVLLAETLFLLCWVEEVPSFVGPVPQGQR